MSEHPPGLTQNAYELYEENRRLRAQITKAREALRAVDLDRTSSLRVAIEAISEALDEGNEG